MSIKLDRTPRPLRKLLSCVVRPSLVIRFGRGGEGGAGLGSSHSESQFLVAATEATASKLVKLCPSKLKKEDWSVVVVVVVVVTVLPKASSSPDSSRIVVVVDDTVPAKPESRFESSAMGAMELRRRNAG